MPEKFPLEHFYRINQPDVWFEYWQDEDFGFGYRGNPDELTDNQLNDSQEFEVEPSDCGWSEQDFGEAPYKLF